MLLMHKYSSQFSNTFLTDNAIHAHSAVKIMEHLSTETLLHIHATFCNIDISMNIYPFLIHTHFPPPQFLVNNFQGFLSPVKCTIFILSSTYLRYFSFVTDIVQLYMISGVYEHFPSNNIFNTS